MFGVAEDGAAGKIPDRIQQALWLLVEAADYAQQTSGDLWEFAVEIRQLRELGLSHNDLRWLVRMGFVEHRREVTVEGDDGRDFRPSGDLTFTKRTCFVLKRGAVRSVRDLVGLESSAAPGPVLASVQNTLPDPAPLKPRWDADRHELRLEDRLIKRFRWPALNQELVLMAFEEEGWPPRIDDPLLPHPDQDPKRRLHDTIKCLNRSQDEPLVRFHGDGTGEGVIWELEDGY